MVGLFLRLPVFDQLSDEVEMFDDEVQWKTPDDYALKLTLAPTTGDQDVETPLMNMGQLKTSDG